MSTRVTPASPSDWFEVSFDEERGLFRLSFDRHTYVRFFSRDEVLALIAELRRVAESRRIAEVQDSIGLVPGPGQGGGAP